MIIGGAQENTLHTVWGLNQHSHFTADLLTGPGLGPEGELISLVDELNIEPIYLPLSRRNINPFYDLNTLMRYYSIIKRGDYDIVHTHSTKAGILGRLAAKWAGVQIIVHTIHGLPFHPYQNWLYNKFYIGLEKMVAPYTDKIISVADAMTDKAVKAGIAAEDKFVTIRSGMQIERFASPRSDRQKDRKDWGVKDDEIVIGKIARLFNLKGHKYLIEAFAVLVKQYPKLRLMFAGDGILLGELEAQAKSLGVLERIVFLGLVKRIDIPAAIAMMDIVVHVSLREGLARVLPQALAQNKPVISFDIDGAREVIIDKKTGLLVKAQDTAALVDALRFMLENPQAAKNLGEAGCKLVRKDFGVELMNDQISAEYVRLLKQKGIWDEEVS